jgi:polysaccharide export outer membrane protein
MIAKSMPDRWVKLIRWCLLLLLPALALSGCYKRSGNIAYNQVDFRAPDAPPSAATAAAYKLSAGDVLTVRVLELDSLSGDQVVDGTGRVNLPLIGPLLADGKTTSELETDLAAKLKQDYLQSPHVVIVLKAAVARTVTVDGAVEKPGVYTIVPTTTLIQTIALANGLSKNANPRRVIVFRQIDGARRAAAFDVKSIRTGEDPDPRIYPADVIVVDGSSLDGNYRLLLRSIPLVGLFARF